MFAFYRDVAKIPTEQLEKLPCYAAALAAAADADDAEDGAADDAAPAATVQQCESPNGSAATPANVVQPSALFDDDVRVGNGKDPVHPRPRAPARQSASSRPERQSPDISGRIDFDDCEFGPESDGDEC